MRPLNSCREISCAVTSVAVAREQGSWGVGELASNRDKRTRSIVDNRYIILNLVSRYPDH
jgi:hypothetical protein